LSEFINSDIVTDHENQFALADLLKCEYFKRQRADYYAAQEALCLNRYRNYVTLLEDLQDIHSYNELHAKSFAKRFRESSKDCRNCEAIFSEVIVYRAYIRGVYERVIGTFILKKQSQTSLWSVSTDRRCSWKCFALCPHFRCAMKMGSPKCIA